MESGLKSGLIVFGVTLLAGTALGVFMFVRYKQSVYPIEDLYAGLTYFVERNQGRFPASEAEFRASEFVELLPGGGIRIRPMESRFRVQVYGQPIADLGAFKVAWGTDLSSLVLDPEGIARDPIGHEVNLVGAGTSVGGLRQLTRQLLRTAQEVRGETSASRPAKAG